MHARIGMNEDALGSESLGAVTGNGGTVIEMAMFCRIEFDSPSVIESRDNPVPRRNGFDDCEITIGDAERFVTHSELDPIPREPLG